MPIRYELSTTTHKLVKHPNRPEWPEAFDLASDSELTAKLEIGSGPVASVSPLPCASTELGRVKTRAVHGRSTRGLGNSSKQRR